MYGSSFLLSGIVYIDADPHICERRIMKRAREGESGIPLEYLKKCRDYHKKWLIDGEDLGNSPVLKIKTNEDATYLDGDLSDCGNKWISEITDFILNMTKVHE
jgi:deoxyadenosine/deoxycytidine kinase